MRCAHVGLLVTGMGISGQQARELFYSSSNLNLDKGYALLFEGMVRIEEIKKAAADRTERDIPEENYTHGLKRLKHLLKSENVGSSMQCLNSTLWMFLLKPN